jgi:hypothetical protein
MARPADVMSGRARGDVGVQGPQHRAGIARLRLEQLSRAIASLYADVDLLIPREVGAAAA